MYHKQLVPCCPVSRDFAFLSFHRSHPPQPNRPQLKHGLPRVVKRQRPPSISWGPGIPMVIVQEHPTPLSPPTHAHAFWHQYWPTATLTKMSFFFLLSCNISRFLCRIKRRFGHLSRNQHRGVGKNHSIFSLQTKVDQFKRTRTWISSQSRRSVEFTHGGQLFRLLRARTTTLHRCNNKPWTVNYSFTLFVRVLCFWAL